MPDRPTYIVTGGAGFVGSGLVAALLARRPRPHVVVIDNFRSGSYANIVEACQRRGVGPFGGEVLAESVPEVAWARLLERVRPGAVFHLAAITDTTVADEALMMRENTGGFDALLVHAAELEVPVVYASSAATYGTPAQTARRVPFPTDAAGSPSNVYGFSKWVMEGQHRRFAGLRADAGKPAPWIVGLRYFNVFGPGEARKGKMASMVLQLAQQMLSGKRPRLFAGGDQARDQVYVDDVVACTMAAAGLGEGGETPSRPTPGVYNLGSGVATSFNQIVAALRPALGCNEAALPTEYFEMPAAIRAFYQDYTCADMAETAKGLAWRPHWTPLDAIAAYAAYLKAGHR